MVRHSKIEFEYNQITKYIYIGTNMCCIGHFKKELLTKGIKADISLDNEKIDAPFGADYFLWIPTINHRAPSLKQIEAGINFINFLEKNKIPMYIHCERGHGRAPALVLAYLVKYKKMSFDEALKLIKKKRPVVHPNKNQRAGVMKFLKK